MATQISNSTLGHGLLKRIDDFDSFREVRNLPPELISEAVIAGGWPGPYRQRV